MGLSHIPSSAPFNLRERIILKAYYIDVWPLS